MSKGNQIIVSSPPRGRFEEGTIQDTSKPGTIVQIVAATAPVQGRFTWKAAASGTDGKSMLGAVLLEDDLQGTLMTVAYVANTRCKIYFPQAGEELNMLCGEVAGTGNTFAIGDQLILDAEDGLLVPYAGSPQSTVAIVLEAVTQAAGSSLVWVKWLGS